MSRQSEAIRQATMSGAEFRAQHGGKVNGSTAPKPMLAASELQIKPVRWLWYPYVPAGMISLLGAPGGAGKGLVCVQMTASVTTGGAWPCSDMQAEPGHVLWCESEDPLAEVVMPRLVAAGADLSKVTFANSQQFRDCDLAAFIKANGTRLIVLSPMMSFLKLREANHEAEVRDSLERIQAGIEGASCGVVGITHTNKKSDLPAIERVLGSVAFVNFVRSVMLVGKDKDEEGWSRLAHAKYNVSIKGRDLQYSPKHVGQDPRDQFVELAWQMPDDDCDIDAIFDRKRSNGEDGKDTAGAWLVNYLSQHGECLRADVVLAGDRAGFKEDALRKAARRNGRVKNRRDGFQGPVYWSLN